MRTSVTSCVGLKNSQEEGGSVAAFGAGGEFTPDEVDGEGEDGEDEQKVDGAVRDVAEEDFDEPEDGEHGGEQEEEHWFFVRPQKSKYGRA